MSDSSSLKRPRFFDGKFLTAADLNAEQNYHITKRRLHNRSLHGFGVVTGLKVSSGSGKIVVQPGLALDCEGNEVVVEAPQSIDFAGLVDVRTGYVGLKYLERCVDPIPVDKGREEHANIQAGFALAVAKENCNRGHRHARGRWLPCGKAHELTIAKLKFTAHGWRVDRRYRPPLVK